MALQVARATLQDLDDLVPLVDAYRQFYKQPSDEASVRAYVQARLAANECVVFVARDALGKALGFTLLYQHFTTVALGHVWLLNDLFTEPTARQRGVGQALMLAAHDFARADGAKRLWLRTATDNATAQALYEKFGMVRDVQFYRYDSVF